VVVVVVGMASIRSGAASVYEGLGSLKGIQIMVEGDGSSSIIYCLIERGLFHELEESPTSAATLGDPTTRLGRIPGTCAIMGVRSWS
jgi:hypothetical protein